MQATPKQLRRIIIGAIVIAVLIHLLGGITDTLHRQREERESRETVQFGTRKLHIERAETSRDREKGLSGRDFLDEEEGLLFVFDTADRYGFWMKDMNFAIDIIWLDEDGTVVHIEDRVVPETFPTVFWPVEPAKYVLEVSAGLRESSGVSAGYVIGFAK